MYQEYSIEYKTTTVYKEAVNGAFWRFLIIPEENPTQQLVNWEFSNSQDCPHQDAINGFGFRTIQLSPRQKFDVLSFAAHFTVIKKEINPFDFQLPMDRKANYATLDKLEFQVDFAPFLGNTKWTTLPDAYENLFWFDTNKTIFKNIQGLNTFVFDLLLLNNVVADVGIPLREVLEKKQGSCRDFTHLFCALARINKIPVRYVSGYLHRGQDYFEDSGMHAWAEVYIPEIGWTGVDPTHNLMSNTDYIKVSHGMDHSDC
ncbi:MAG: transglutaminase domain-containing protein, partial [Bacteroidota bacterium]